MQIGLVGLGKMGWNLALNCIAKGHEVIGYDIDEVVRMQAKEEGFAVAASLPDLAGRLQQRRVIWLMIPAGSPVDIMRSSGEGKWMVETALEKNISTPVIALSLLMRYRSLQEDTFSGKLVASPRNEFGGHAVTRK